VYPVALSRMVMLLKSMLRPVSDLFSATADFHDWPRRLSHVLCTALPSMCQSVPHRLYRIHRAHTIYIPSTLRPSLSFVCLGVSLFFFTGTWVVLCCASRGACWFVRNCLLKRLFRCTYRPLLLSLWPLPRKKGSVCRRNVSCLSSGLKCTYWT
jgi:hypothetical protein